MGYQAGFWLNRRPCFECNDDGETVLYAWIDLLIAIQVDALIEGRRGAREVTNDPFSTSDDRVALCPYCKFTPIDDDYDDGYRAADF